MEKKLISGLLKVSLLLFSSLLFGQEWRKLPSPNIRLTPTAHSADIQGNFYLGFQDGRLTKYNHAGEEQQTFSLSNQAPISLIEAQNSLKLFVFNFDNQKITYLDRFSSTPRTYFLADYTIPIGMMACPTPDGNAWVAENNPRILRKIDLLRKSTILEVQTSIGDSIRFMRTQHNLLIIADEQGVHVFDQFGAKKHFIAAINVNYIQLINDQLFFSSNDRIITFDPYSGKILKTQSAPTKAVRVAIRLPDKYLLIGESIELYELKN